MAKKTKTKIINDPEREQIIIENPPPPKKPKSPGTSTGLPRDIQFLGEALVRETNRINELELALDDMNKKLIRVMGRMGL